MERAKKHVNPVPEWAAATPVTWVLRNAARDGLLDVVASQLKLGCPVDTPDVVRAKQAPCISAHCRSVLACCSQFSRTTVAMLSSARVRRAEREHTAVDRCGSWPYRGGAGATRRGR